MSRQPALFVEGSAWPDTIVLRGKAEEKRRYVPERKAKRVIVSNGLYGSCTCSACDGRIDTNDKFCRHCGTALEGGWK